MTDINELSAKDQEEFVKLRKKMFKALLLKQQDTRLMLSALRIAIKKIEHSGLRTDLIDLQRATVADANAIKNTLKILAQ